MTGVATTTSRGWVRCLWGYMLRHRRNVALSTGAALFGAICQTAVPLVAREVVDTVILHRATPLWPWLVLLAALAVLIFGAAYVRRYRGGQVGLQVQYDLRNDMHDHLQAMDLETLSRMPTGQLVARANSDTTLVQALLNFIPIMSGNVLLMAMSLGVMIYLSPLLAVVSIVIAPALVVVSYRMRWRVFPATWDAQQREGELVSIVDEDLNGVRVVKAFGQERRELERVAESAKVLYGSQMRAVRLQSRYQPIMEAIPSFGQVGILALGGWMALNHDISLGTFLAFSTYVIALMSPARQLAGVLTIGQQARAGMERILQLLDTPPAVSDPPDALTLPPLQGDISFRAVRFRYGEGPPVLTGVDLDVAAGERVAIVGPSGSGKSTLAMLVSRFYDPTEGTVEVDGVDVRRVALASLRRQVGIVYEDSFLFSDSVRANIAYGHPGATDEQVEAAARAASAHDFIEALPRGYETVVGERGLTLSGGQRQRVALARAILFDPRVLILDDATSAIDSRTEAEIHDALREVMKGRTTILVAHRRSTLHLADRVVVLAEGRIVDQGTHDELVRRSARYRSLLSGLDEADHEEEVEGRIEALAAGAGDGDDGAEAKVAPVSAGWDAPPAAAGQRAGGGAAIAAVRAASIGPGLGGGGGGWRMSLVPTPELLARVSALHPVRDVAQVDLDREARQDRSFRLATLISEFRWPLLLGLLFVVVDAVANLAGPILVKTGIDAGVTARSVTVLFLAAGLFFAITFGDMLDEIAETFVTGRTAQRIMLSLRIRIWAQLQRLSLDYYESEMAGRIMTRMTTDVDQFESLIENGVLSALVAMVTFVGVGIALVVIDPELGLCTLSVVIPLSVATVVFRRRAAVLYDQARERIAIVNADFQESISGVREAQTFVHERATRDRFHHLGADYLESRVQAQRLVATYFPFIQLLSGVAQAIVLGVGAQLVVHGQLTTGALIAFFLYIDMFFSPIQSLSQVFDAWQQTRVSVGRISELMQIDTRTPDPVDPIRIGQLRGDVVLDGVRFAYPTAPRRPGITSASGNGAAGVRPRGPADPTVILSDDAGARKPPEALRGIDIEIEPGQTVALVGETGAGKSTVMKLIARFYDPDAGVVSVDGDDLRALTLDDYRRQLGYVPQEAFLFSGTIRDNIAYGRPDADDAEVERAARAVGAHGFIAQLPGGYHHELSERGRSLSAGQRQLVALARAELVDPSILLLDEATSNLDLPTEAKVAAAVREVTRDRTTVLIAHRLQTARAADRIVVLHAGEVVETGTHAELLALGGRYAAMWEAFELFGGAAQLSAGRTSVAMSDR
ncbi:MAG TPA: ABC transporter ATP-binding protein [Acidimicrobiales bacterium]|nr:ABC transporter ATP-binding protein [Acidimicrobiales bacterium]